jgi:hypothetical protein
VDARAIKKKIAREGRRIFDKKGERTTSAPFDRVDQEARAGYCPTIADWFCTAHATLGACVRLQPFGARWRSRYFRPA